MHLVSFHEVVSENNVFIYKHRGSLKEASFVERTPDLKLNPYLLKTLSQLKL